MERIGKLIDAEEKVLSDARALLGEVKRVVASDPKDPFEAVGILSELRDVAYENLNQIQHEYLILAAVKHLIGNSLVHPDTEWSWNPRQTGTAKEPDLLGDHQGCCLISAEVTTSRRPIGTIVGRMQSTLEKLNGPEFRGAKYYFVRTDAMERKAKSIVDRDGLDIDVVRLSHVRDEL